MGWGFGGREHERLYRKPLIYNPSLNRQRPVGYLEKPAELAFRGTLKKDRSHRLLFYGFPAPHWGYIRTTNPIESGFAAVRLRMTKTKNRATEKNTLRMAFNLINAAQKKWKRRRDQSKLVLVIEGVKLKDRERVEHDQQPVTVQVIHQF